MTHSKKTLALLLAVLLIFAISRTANGRITSYASDAVVFTDVPADTWYTEAVKWCYEHGIIKGTTATTFSPDDTMNRAMLATVLYRATGSPAVTTSADFSDMTEGAYYEKAVAWAAENAIIAGYGNGHFGPTDPATREQIATVLWRYAGNPEVEEVEPFADAANVSRYAVDAVNWAKSNEIIYGVGNNRFNPTDNATRAQVAVILYRFLSHAEEPAPPPSGEGTPIILNMNGTDIHAKLYDNAAAKSFLDLLPYTVTVSRATDDLCGSVSEQLAHDPAEDQDTWAIGEIGWFDGWFTILCDNEEGMPKRTRTIIGKVDEEDIPVMQSFTGSVKITITLDESFSDPAGGDEEDAKLEVVIGNAVYTATMADTEAAREFARMLPMTITLNDYGGFEKVGSLGVSLTTDNSQITTTAGDIVLYNGNSIVMFYGSNSWSYTRLAKVDDLTGWAEALGSSSVSVTFRLTGKGQKPPRTDLPAVYMTTDISPEGLMAVYEALGWEPTGKLAVKLSTGEPPASNYLRPELIRDLVQSVNGTIVECNTAYGGSRAQTAMHYQVAKDHGFTDIADFQILDEDGSMTLRVSGGSVLTENYVGKAFADYDSYLVLSHFKGHQMAGYGGAIKNISIGLGSSEGKAWIHSGGTSRTNTWGEQDAFLEAMAEAGKSVSDYLGNGDRIVYINVMNRLSVDCDCNGRPAAPDMHDIGILASTDPVALDQACLDLIYAQKDGDGASLVRRIESLNGFHTLEHAEEIGLGSRTYTLVKIDG